MNHAEALASLIFDLLGGAGKTDSPLEISGVAYDGSRPEEVGVLVRDAKTREYTDLTVTISVGYAEES